MTVHLNTFSIVVRCPRSGVLGDAVNTEVPAVAVAHHYVVAVRWHIPARHE